MSMIHVLWHDSMMISSTESVSHELRRLKLRFHVGSVTVGVARGAHQVASPQDLCGEGSSKASNSLPRHYFLSRIVAGTQTSTVVPAASSEWMSNLEPI